MIQEASNSRGRVGGHPVRGMYSADDYSYAGRYGAELPNDYSALASLVNVHCRIAVRVPAHDKQASLEKIVCVGESRCRSRNAANPAAARWAVRGHRADLASAYREDRLDVVPFRNAQNDHAVYFSYAVGGPHDILLARSKPVTCFAVHEDLLHAEPRFGGRIHILDPVPPGNLLPWVASADVGVMSNQPRRLTSACPLPTSCSSRSPPACALVSSVSRRPQDHPHRPARATGCGVRSDGRIRRSSPRRSPRSSTWTQSLAATSEPAAPLRHGSAGTGSRSRGPCWRRISGWPTPHFGGPPASLWCAQSGRPPTLDSDGLRPHGAIVDIIQWDVRNWGRALGMWDQWIPDVRGSRVLDIGARDGGTSLYWAARSSGRLLRRGGRRPAARQLHARYAVAESVTYAKIDALRIALADATFDVVCSSQSLVASAVRGAMKASSRPCGRCTACSNRGAAWCSENTSASPLHRSARRRSVPWGKRSALCVPA